MIDFPASPTLGQQFTAAGVVWTWDGTKWLPSGLSPTVVPGINDNRLINGDMRIDQRNNGASGTVNGYTVDRWQYVATQTAKGTWKRNPNSPSPAAGFPYGLFFGSLSAYTPLAGDVFAFNQLIEADMISDFLWGTANAQPVTLSFWAFSSLTGTFGGSVQNYVAQNRSYPFSYTIPTANTWAKIVVTIPGDTAGTWALSGNAAALAVWFDLGSGSTYRGSAGAWAGANNVGTTGSVNVVATNGATFVVTGVKLEIGSVATPYNRQSLAKSMADCQRYYQKIGGSIVADLIVEGSSGVAGAHLSSTLGLAAMRAAPTANIVGSFSLTNVGSTTLYPGVSTLGIQIIATAAGSTAWYNSSTSAYVTLSAEL